MNLSVNQSSSSLSFLNEQIKKREELNEEKASGKRINEAADDAAGLQISSRLTSQINAYEQLSNNSQDQINSYNVENSQYGAINESLQRANVLSIQSANPLSDPNAIQSEFDEITEQVNAIAEEVLGDPNFLSGLDANDPQATQTAIEDAFTVISENASANGAQSNALESQSSTYEVTSVNLSDSRSAILDADYAKISGEESQLEALILSSVTAKKDEEERKGVLINQIV